MRYPLDIFPNTKDSMLFWIGKFVKFKINTLSHSRVRSKKEIQNAISYLNSKEKHEMSDLSELVRRLRTEGGFDGIKTFFLPVKALYEHLENNPIESLKHIGNDYLADFLSSSTATYSDATKINYRNAITNFFNYLSENNENELSSGSGYIYHLDISKWQGLSGKSGRKHPAYLSVDEVKDLFIALENHDLFENDRAAIFYNLFIRMILYSGMRVSEALSIQKNKISFVENRYLQFPIKGKGNNNRLLSIDKELLDPYFSIWEKNTETCLGELLFCSPSNPSKTANPSSISTKLKMLLRSAGISKNKEGVHILRHTYATILYDKTRDLVLVQELLGHSNPNTTRIYTHIGEDKMRRASNVFKGIGL